MRKQKIVFFLIVGSAVVIVGLTLALRQKLAHVSWPLFAPEVAIEADVDATVAAALTATQTAQPTDTSAPIGTSTSTPSHYHPTPHIFAYAMPLDIAGTGPLSIEANDHTLLHLQLDEDIKEIEFVKSLTLHLLTSDDNVTDGPITIDFMIWGPFSGGWSMNGGENKLNWGKNEIEIKYPDRLVSREGDIYMSIRNWGNQTVEIQDLSFTLVSQNTDGTETIYSPTP